MRGVNISGAPLFTIMFELFSAVGLLYNGDVLTMIFKVVVILLLNEVGLGGLPRFFFTEGGVLKFPSVRELDETENDISSCFNTLSLCLLLPSTFLFFCGSVMLDYSPQLVISMPFPKKYQKKLKKKLTSTLMKICSVSSIGTNTSLSLLPENTEL